MQKKTYRETFNDGYLTYGHKKTLRSTTNKRIGEGFVGEGKLAFKEVSCRESDFQLAGILGSNLTMKVKTLYPPSFHRINKNKLKVVINRSEYDVIKVDPDNKLYLYFYLQEVGDLVE